MNKGLVKSAVEIGAFAIIKSPIVYELRLRFVLTPEETQQMVMISRLQCRG
jgi:hypothetical protein